MELLGVVLSCLRALLTTNYLSVLREDSTVYPHLIFLQSETDKPPDFINLRNEYTHILHTSGLLANCTAGTRITKVFPYLLEIYHEKMS